MNLECITKNNIWKNCNMFKFYLGQLHCCIKIWLFNPICCSFYGSPLWHMVQQFIHCVVIGESLRSLWGVHPTTHCDVITVLSNQLPLIITLQNKFIRFLTECFSHFKLNIYLTLQILTTW